MFKNRNTVLAVGILAIFILIISQVIIIKGVWVQKDEMLLLRYRSLSQEAASSVWFQRSFDPYDTVRLMLNSYSDMIVPEVFNTTDTAKRALMLRDLNDYFLAVLNQEQDFSEYLSAYFERMGFEKNFKHRIIIKNLEIIDNYDTISIVRDDSFFRGRGGQNPPPNINKSSILVSRPWLSDNYYNMNFEYFIDFSDKKKMILGEISASITLSLLSVVIVMIMFIITYKNLMKEKKLSDLKTDFINNMTHELKTPLATITVAGKTLELEKVRKNDEMLLNTAQLIGKQSVHLNQLINMILEISMWERTQFEINMKETDVFGLVDDIINGFKNGAGKNATINTNLNFDSAKAQLDNVYFTTLINNLLSNAVKYCDQEPVIDIEGKIDAEQFIVSISDNGIGINKNDLKHVFDKFYRVSGGNIHKYKGLGLGLYYVKKIAEAHGGDVTVSSKIGKGSTFTITIPLIKS